MSQQPLQYFGGAPQRGSTAEPGQHHCGPQPTYTEDPNPQLGGLPSAEYIRLTRERLEHGINGLQDSMQQLRLDLLVGHARGSLNPGKQTAPGTVNLPQIMVLPGPNSTVIVMPASNESTKASANPVVIPSENTSGEGTLGNSKLACGSGRKPDTQPVIIPLVRHYSEAATQTYFDFAGGSSSLASTQRAENSFADVFSGTGTPNEAPPKRQSEKQTNPIDIPRLNADVVRRMEAEATRRDVETKLAVMRRIGELNGTSRVVTSLMEGEREFEREGERMQRIAEELIEEFENGPELEQWFLDREVFYDHGTAFVDAEQSRHGDVSEQPQEKAWTCPWPERRSTWPQQMQMTADAENPFVKHKTISNDRSEKAKNEREQEEDDGKEKSEESQTTIEEELENAMNTAMIHVLDMEIERELMEMGRQAEMEGKFEGKW
ncbi:hypothetical protein RUND412_004947 [Rhizina undulata]